MSEGSDELVLDRLIHEPARLAILTVLSSVRAGDFEILCSARPFSPRATSRST